MIKMPTSYKDGSDVVLHRYYGNFLLDVVKRNRLNGMYGLTGTILQEALDEYGAKLGDVDELIFQDDRMSTLFIMRWS